MLQLLGLSSGILSILCYIPYIRDILYRKTKPERASWLIWTILGIIAFFSQLAKGAANSLWMPGIQILGDILILLLAIRLGVGGFTRRDYVALVFAGIGLVLWYFTKEAAFALFIIILIETAGSILTILKSYEEPESETLITWILSGIAGFLALLSVGKLDIVLLSFPVYIVVVDSAVVSAIYLGKRQKKKSA